MRWSVTRCSKERSANHPTLTHALLRALQRCTSTGEQFYMLKDEDLIIGTGPKAKINLGDENLRPPEEADEIHAIIVYNDRTKYECLPLPRNVCVRVGRCGGVGECVVWCDGVVPVTADTCSTLPHSHAFDDTVNLSCSTIPRRASSSMAPR